MIVNIIGWILLFLAINLGATVFTSVGEMEEMTFRQSFLCSCKISLIIIAGCGVLFGIVAMISH